MVRVWTGRLGEGRDSEINTTMKSARTAIGKVLAPTPELVFGHKVFMGDRRFKRFTAVTDEDYKEQYLELIRGRFLFNRSHFQDLLERDEITITCYCDKDKWYCHRFIIATHILPKCARAFGIPYHYAGEC